MKVFNRKFSRDYQELERIEAGLVLIGAEVKSVRAGHIRLDEAFVKIIGDEAYLINADVQIYQFSRPQGYDPRRSRKLLIHKKELLKLRVKMSGSSKLTIIPVSCYNKGHIFKLEIALAKGRRDIEKKNLEKRRDIKLEEKREAKEYLKT